MKELSKKQRFFRKFETISNYDHKLWKTINNLLSSKRSNASATKVIKVADVKVDNPTGIANRYLNEFFCNLGQSLADIMNCTDNENLTNYLTNRINKSVFLIPSNLQEISRIISSLKNSSSFGSYGISSSFLKIDSGVVSLPLSLFFDLFTKQACILE